MATKKVSTPKEYVRFSWEVLKLKCEWIGCSAAFEDLSYFMSHVKDHIATITPDITACHWMGCHTEILDFNEMTRHIFFHAYHSKLKCLGMNILQRSKLPQCAMDSSNCNLIPELPDEFNCFWQNCDDSFSNAEGYYRHVEAHAEDYPKGKKIEIRAICLWRDCKTSFTTLYRLKEHLRSHTQEKVASCPNCGGMFSSRTKFCDHLHRQAFSTPGTSSSSTVTSEKDIKALECGCCLRKFTTDRLLRDHMRGHVNHYKCPFCDMTLPSPSALKTHVMYRHTNARNYSCKFCDYKAKSNFDLRRHLENHSDNQMYSCPVEECSYSSQKTGNLARHVSSVHKMEGYSYLCHICSKQYSRGYALTRHLIKEHGLSWPSGHSRFRYQLQSNGHLLLQTIRYESYELSTVYVEDMEGGPGGSADPDDPGLALKDSSDAGVSQELVAVCDNSVVNSEPFRNCPIVNTEQDGDACLMLQDLSDQPLVMVQSS